MKTMLSSFVGHSMIDIGTQAMAGIGRSTSATGNTNSRMSRKRPITRPSGTAITVASMKPMRMRRQLNTTCEMNFGSANARAALEHLLRRRHVEKADVEVHAILGQQVPGEEESESASAPSATARSCRR